MRKRFGDRLKELRLEKNMTQEDLGNYFNAKKSSISHYESNTRMPDTELIEQLADFFSVSVDYILGKTDERNHAGSHKVFVPHSLEVLRGSMTYDEFSRDIGEKMNDILYSKIFSPAHLKEMEKGNEHPNEQKLLSLALYAQVPVDFFYRPNQTRDDFSLARSEYQRLKAAERDEGKYELPSDLQQFVKDPENLRYLYFAKKTKEKGINPDDIVNFTLKY